MDPKIRENKLSDFDLVKNTLGKISKITNSKSDLLNGVCSKKWTMY